MHTTLWTLANTDWVQLFVIVLGLLIGGGGWLFNKVREAQAEQGEKMRRAQRQFDTTSRGGGSGPQDLAARRREQLQEMARQRNQQTSAQQTSVQRTRQPTAAQRPQTRPQTPSRQQPARRPQQQPQPSATRRPTNQRPAAAPQASSDRRQSKPPAPPQVHKLTSPVGEDDVIELPEIKGGPNLLGIPLAKAVILKEILDRPVGMRDPQQHPLEVTD